MRKSLITAVELVKRMPCEAKSHRERTKEKKKKRRKSRHRGTIMRDSLQKIRMNWMQVTVCLMPFCFGARWGSL